MAIELLIQNGSVLFAPVVAGGLTWETVRKNSPGKLAFTVVKDGTLRFEEGNPVRLTVNGCKVFYGFVFTKKRGKGETIDVVAYDQLRYFKNKDTLIYEDKTAAGLLAVLATTFRLQTGTVEDTGYMIESRVEENKTLFEMMQTALDQTLLATKKLYVLFDDFGRLTLKNIVNMGLDLLIDEQTGENFAYSSSIDSQTYNKVKLTYDNDKTGKREAYIVQDGANINRWGVLQYYESLQNPIGAVAKAEALLKQYNQKTRKLAIQNAFGDPRVRAGASLYVSLNLGDVIANQRMVVERVTHTFDGDEHRMDLTLIGGEFLA